MPQGGPAAEAGTGTRLSLPNGQQPQCYFLKRGERSFPHLRAGAGLTNRGEKSADSAFWLGPAGQGAGSPGTHPPRADGIERQGENTTAGNRQHLEVTSGDALAVPVPVINLCDHGQVTSPLTPQSLQLSPLTTHSIYTEGSEN